MWKHAKIIVLNTVAYLRNKEKTVISLSNSGILYETIEALHTNRCWCDREDSKTIYLDDSWCKGSAIELNYTRNRRLRYDLIEVKKKQK